MTPETIENIIAIGKTVVPAVFTLLGFLPGAFLVNRFIKRNDKKHDRTDTKLDGIIEAIGGIKKDVAVETALREKDDRDIKDFQLSIEKIWEFLGRKFKDCRERVGENGS